MNSPTSTVSSAVSSAFSFELPIATTFSELMISLPSEEHDYQDEAKLPALLHYAPYPTTAKKSAPTDKQVRRRRKREAIAIPEDVVSMADPQEVKRIKNRIAAARLRERSQQKIRDLEAEVIALRERNAALEARLAATSCARCNGSSDPTTVDASTSTCSAPASPKSSPSSPLPSVHSPSSISDGAAMTQQDVMTEFESDLLHQLLWQSEEMAAMQMQL